MNIALLIPMSRSADPADAQRPVVENEPQALHGIPTDTRVGLALRHVLTSADPSNQHVENTLSTPVTNATRYTGQQLVPARGPGIGRRVSAMILGEG
jgi:hypothetical protein